MLTFLMTLCLLLHSLSVGLEFGDSADLANQLVPGILSLSLMCWDHRQADIPAWVLILTHVGQPLYLLKHLLSPCCSLTSLPGCPPGCLADV